MFGEIIEVVVVFLTFVFVNWFSPAPGNPFAQAEDVVETANGGDLIEFKRKKFCLFPYKHWAVYIGDRETIGVGASDKRKESRIEKKRISDLCVNKCRVNNLEEAARRKFLRAFPNDRIVQRALACFERNITITYSLRFNNCEHFATFCRYDFPFSVQVERQPMLRRDRDRLESVTDYALQFSRANFNFHR